jgi:hypothetical protein
MTKFLIIYILFNNSPIISLILNNFTIPLYVQLYVRWLIELSVLLFYILEVTRLISLFAFKKSEQNLAKIISLFLSRILKFYS